MAGGKTDAQKLVEGDISKMDLYALLEIDENDTEKAIVKAYRKMARKYHPDKNPDDQKAGEMFHKLSLALQVLTDAAARAAYDKIVKAKKAAEERHHFLDSKRKKFKEELEQRERYLGKETVKPDLSQAEKLKKEVDRLRKEGSRMLEEEQERLRREIQAERESGNKTKGENVAPRLKLRWRCPKDDTAQNGGYSHELLFKLLNKYGNIIALIISKKKAGSAIVEYENACDAQLAVENERGLVENPLSINWLSGKPDVDIAASWTIGSRVPEANVDVLSGFSFCTNPSSVNNETSTNGAKSCNTSSDRSNSESPITSKWDAFGETETKRSDCDFESIVLRNLRQAQERKRLEEQIKEEEREVQQ